MENPDILIVDDDPMVGELSRDLLTDEGYKVMLVQDSMEAVRAIKDNLPKLVITDIMMPGISGMDICKSVKSDHSLKHIKIIVVSGKSYQVEQQRAFQFGADYFLQKPYNVETFSQTVRKIMEGAGHTMAPQIAPSEAPQVPADAPQASDLAEAQIRVTFWGARGLPSVIPNAPSRYGHQTACVSVETKDQLFVFDAGTGIVPLGEEIIAKKRYYKNIWVFISHFHLDHILGLGNFAPIDDPSFAIHLIGANDPEKSLKEMAQSTFFSSFSLTKHPPKANIDVYEVLEDNYELAPGVKLSTMYANHPTNTMIYSLELMGKKVIYAPDSEIWGDATAFQDYDEKLATFCRNADILIHDTFFSDSEYETRKSEGHSGLSNVLDFAAEKSGVKELVLFHLNPDYSDEQLDKILQSANARVQAKGSSLVCHMPEETKTIMLHGNTAAQP